MLGLVEYERRGRGRAAVGDLYGLPVLRAAVDPGGMLGERRLRRAGQTIRRGGVCRVLTPADFDRWDLLRRSGLAPVDPSPFLRAWSAELAVAALERQGLAPDRAVVALRAPRADGEMARAAAQLCPRVRHLVICSPRGGEELARWLRQQFGLPILPPGEESQVDLHFRPDGGTGPGVKVELYGNHPELAGLTLCAPDLAEGHKTDISVLTALWEGGKVGKNTLKIT